jgi:hypothetical protein
MLSSAPITTSNTIESGSHFDKPNAIVTAPNDDDQQSATRALPVGVLAAERGHRDRADRLRRAQHAEPERVDVEDVLRDHRKQLCDAGEQHREHVERQRWQEQW